MPIANCYIKERLGKQLNFDQLAIDWASELEIDKKEITMNVISSFQQYGAQYAVMVNLFLPSLWSSNDVEKIQQTLARLLSRYLDINLTEVFIMTTILESGHVLSNGQIEKW